MLKYARMPDKSGWRADGGGVFIVQKIKFYLAVYKEILGKE